jgi:hypothetical protein
LLVVGCWLLVAGCWWLAAKAEAEAQVAKARSPALDLAANNQQPTTNTKAPQYPAYRAPTPWPA